MTSIELHGPPVVNAHGPGWSVYVSVTGDESGLADVLIKLGHRADETFVQKFGDRSLNVRLRDIRAEAIAHGLLKKETP